MQYRSFAGTLFLPLVALLCATACPPVARAAGAAELGFDTPGDLVVVKANAVDPIVIEKVPATDCRLGRAFTIAPIDGRRDTRPDAAPRLYPLPLWNGGAAADAPDVGLHLRLADRRGFNFVRVIGDYRGALYHDLAAFIKPPARPRQLVARTDTPAAEDPERLRKKLLVTEMKGDAPIFRKLLAVPAVTRSVSFLGGPEQFLADVGFYRVGPPDKPYRSAAEWWLGAPGEAPAAVAPALAARFGSSDRAVVGGTTTAPATAGAVPLTPRAFTHCLIGPLQWEEGLTAVELDLQVEGIPARCPLTVRLQDPLNGRQELIAADISLSGPGHARLILDFPKQLLPRGAYLWLSLATRDGGRLVTGKDGSRLRLLAVPRDSALDEALAYRKLFLRGYLARLAALSPSDGVLNQAALRSVTISSAYDDALHELMETLDVCRWLAPDDAEVGEYCRWLAVPPREPDWPMEAARPRLTNPALGPTPALPGPGTAA